MDFGLRKKVAIVTAASKGLGKATAFALAKEGARLVICSRNKAEIEATAKEIRQKTKATVVPVVADVAQPAQLKRLVSIARKRFGTVHILVSNAGGPPHADLLKSTDEEWLLGVELTLLSTVRLLRLVLPMMVRQKWGRIITITSITAKQPIDELLISSTLRPGILGLTKVASNTFARNNITVNTVCPGFILTDRQKELMKARSQKDKLTMDEYLSKMSGTIPAGRLGTPEEVGNVIAFLASVPASYINGVNLLIDGGLAKGIH
jgi:3-oxoacyl-[acyl-carrier protein] reductase